MILYDNDFSTCAQKVRITLNEKMLEWETQWLDLRAGDQLRPDYLALNRSGVVPTLLLDDLVLVESTLILEFLEERFPFPKLMPVSPGDRYAVRRWMLRLDAGLHGSIGALSIGIAFRHEILAKGPGGVEAHLAAIPDPLRRQRWRNAIDKGTDDAAFRQALVAWLQTLDLIEARLTEGTWLAGDEMSLADISYAPYVSRLEALGILAGWDRSGSRTGAWFDRMKSRASYTAAMDDVINPQKQDFVRQCGHREQGQLKRLIDENVSGVC